MLLKALLKEVLFDCEKIGKGCRPFIGKGVNDEEIGNEYWKMYRV
jgi:hypothetical protein